MVEGYRGEPYVRIAADGTVAVNHRSPTYYLNDDRFAEGVEVPAGATPKATPDWREVDRTGRYAWHDHRIHWMAHTVPPQVKDEGRRTKVFDWKVPLTVGGRPATIHGRLIWVGEQGGGFPLGAGIALGGAVAGADSSWSWSSGAAAVAPVRRPGAGGLVRPRRSRGLAALAVALLACPAGAQAHAVLEATSPARGAQLRACAGTRGVPLRRARGGRLRLRAGVRR